MIRYLLVYSPPLSDYILVSRGSSTTPWLLPPRVEYGFNFGYDDEFTSLNSIGIRRVIFEKGRQMIGTPDSLNMPRIPEEMLPKLFDHCRQEIYRR